MSKTLVIAEVGVNHNGSMDMARALIDHAVDSGADVVKFQSFNADKLVTKSALRAQYQNENLGGEGNQYDMLQALELSEKAHHELLDYCALRGIDFLSTAFDFESFDLLEKFNLPYIKIPSGDITFGAMLLRAARSGKKIILSTGMADMDEIRDALAVIAYGMENQGNPGSLEQIRACYGDADFAGLFGDRVAVLHCVTQYPCPPANAQLAAMDAIHRRFGLPVGYSDHTLGIAIPIAAVARGACVIEKHITLDRDLPGPDHAASLEPQEFKQMVSGIREVEVAVGEAVKQPNPDEIKTREAARRSLVAVGTIEPGEDFTQNNIASMRPGTGISPMQVWDKLGARSDERYEPDDLIK